MDQAEEIKRKIDVVTLVSSYLSLKKAGRNYRACCPFHKEKTPSFMVSPEKQIWYCFGCNQGGDIFSFIEKIEGLDFVGALNMLADRAGVILDRTNPVQRGKKDVLFNILELAKKFFSYMLNEHAVGREAKKYLIEKRLLSPQTLEEFSIGYAPDSMDLLKKFLIKKGFSEKDILSAGLLAEKGRGTMDKFRDRIIFPICNVNGKVIGFGGRIFKEKKDVSFTPPKYLNSPQTDVYDKSATIYGLELAKESIRESDLAIIVEGYLDVISSHQAGVKNIVASSGTALTERQVEILSRYTENIAFCFDSDEAGQIATKRAMEMTRFSNINVKAIVLPEGKDPDELIKKDSALWLKSAELPVSIVEFYYNQVFRNNNLGNDSEDKKKIAKEMVPVITAIGSMIERAHWIKKISYDLNVAEKYIMEAVDNFKVQSSKFKVGESVKADDIDSNKTLRIKISQEVLLLLSLVLHPEKIKELFEKIKEDDLVEELSKKLYKRIYLWHNDEKNTDNILNIEYLKKELESEDKSNLDVLFFLASSFFDELDQQESFRDIDELTENILKNKKEKRKKEIEKEISFLNKEKDKERIRRLLRELQSLV